MEKDIEHASSVVKSHKKIKELKKPKGPIDRTTFSFYYLIVRLTKEVKVLHVAVIMPISEEINSKHKGE